MNRPRPRPVTTSPTSLALGAGLLLATLAGCATTPRPAPAPTTAPGEAPPGGSALPAPAEAQLPPREREAADFQRDFNQALRLLDTAQPVAAGEAFEACAAAHPADPRVPLALFNAALAWEKAGQPERSAGLRQRLMARYPGSREAEAAQPMLAALRSSQGKKDEAIRLYRDFVERFPDAPSRCSALFNLGATLDEVRRPVEAAGAYLAFGTDPRCAGSEPSKAASILYRAGEQLERGEQMVEARKAYQACADVAGVTEVAARRLQDEARKRARR